MFHVTGTGKLWKIIIFSNCNFSIKVPASNYLRTWKSKYMNVERNVRLGFLLLLITSLECVRIAAWGAKEHSPQLDIP